MISLRKALPIWAMPKGIFWRDDAEHIQEVDVNSLRGFGAQIDDGCLNLRAAP